MHPTGGVGIAHVTGTGVETGAGHLVPYDVVVETTSAAATPFKHEAYILAEDMACRADREDTSRLTAPKRRRRSAASHS